MNPIENQFLLFITISITIITNALDCHNETLQYPFGLLPESHIRLNCSTSGDIVIGEFPIHTITHDSIKIRIETNCRRPVNTLLQLYGHNYAPTTNNGLLLQNCTVSMSCNVPRTNLSTRFDVKSCGGTGTANASSNDISCYKSPVGNNSTKFIEYGDVVTKGCRYLLSAISSVSLLETRLWEIQVVELGWWVEGQCHCDKDAVCTVVRAPPDGRSGFRCRCRDQFIGDGYAAGAGCRKASSNCNPGDYISGRCRGTTRIVVFVGGTVAIVSLTISVILVCCFLRRRHTNSSNINGRKLCLAEAKRIMIPIYSYKEIEKATHNFSNKQTIGTGAYGTVYSGKLNNDKFVAIKRIKHRDNNIDQIMNEIELISSVNHPNLVRLLGCSIENGEQILVYEYMPNGTLLSHLQRERGNGLTWPVRLKIALETAQAIAHLHSSIHPPIFHRDIKSNNILLDFNYTAKLADFGLSRIGITEISHISTAPQGTPGYLDPQYHQDFQLSDKSDVYSFGVVLVEIITALKAVDFSRSPKEINLAAFATDRVIKGNIVEIIDPILNSNMEESTSSSIGKVAELAFRCLAYHRDMRPSMVEVVEELELIIGDRKWCTINDEMDSYQSFSSSYSSSKPLSLNSLSSIGKGRDNSSLSVSVHDSWLSEQSSNSFVNSIM